MTDPSVRIRSARPRDLPACARLAARSIRDLVRRQGESPPRLGWRDMLPFMHHALGTDPKGFVVAVVRGRIVCIGITILRGKTHFLAQFFALPGIQGQGIGRRVLARAFEEPNPPADVIRTVVASLDLRAQALYVKFGMIPRTLVYTVKGRPPRAPPASPIVLRQIGPAGRLTKEARDLAARFDVPLRGARRDVDHRFWADAVPGTRFLEARLRGRTVGYAILHGNGRIGPVGVRDASRSHAVLSAVLARARDLRVRQVTAWIPGLNEGALRAALDAGLKVDFVTVWMSSKDVGDLAAYIPSGGVLF